MTILSGFGLNEVQVEKMTPVFLKNDIILDQKNAIRMAIIRIDENPPKMVVYVFYLLIFNVIDYPKISNPLITLDQQNRYQL
ncbi:unnamed protein product (macronuclear) [Paramecium tetraurelia]|uniref:Uncharacterized protein n=1 Tax=Paramecium tetraurelia TaxID=5888 RepID=A0BQC7_PARTE|nr:uncharacterized protein GSPATT00030973001 [Paramecium tetraurelia]CAK60744.1 unnamed protein product [Paramecium tetraurelia]|eukprot:XP_001428142.1 hypothetical protein (macronuclear) [Paramecium tetraurelia strain d4-2]